MFGFESANLIAPGGVSVTKNPLDSIVRYHNNMLLHYKALSALLQSQFFLTNFPKTFKRLFPKLVERGDSNPHDLIKLYQPKQHTLVPSRVKFYLERFSPTTKGMLNNSFIEFRFENENKIGNILFIDKEASHLAVAELSKKRLTIDLRDSLFRVEGTNRAFQVAFDYISHVFWICFSP